MPSHPERFFRWPLLAASFFLFAAPEAFAQRVSARDQVAVDTLNQRMATAEQRYRDALVLVANSDSKGVDESNQALEDMEDVLVACARQRGCHPSTLLASYKRLLKEKADAESEEAGDEVVDLLDDGTDHSTVRQVLEGPEAARIATLLNDQRHAFDRMVEYNPAVQAGIRRWLTDMRSSLITSYDNYQNMRSELYPNWERDGLPEALLFGIMAKESNGRVHSTSRAGAAGPMQFMPATGRRFGLGPDGTGFDTRYDPRGSGDASAAYINERLHELNNNIEFALAAYNGGEGRAARVMRQFPGRSFWDEAVYNQFPAETKDYVPMVIAAAWLFLHPTQYGLEFPKVDARASQLKLAKDTSIYELTICLGNGGTREGFMRPLRNLNPRYQADALIPAGTVLRANAKITSLYNRHCVQGPRADLARTLINADVGQAIVRASGVVSVGDATPLEVPAAVAPRPTPAARTHRVAKGETLGRIAQRYQCNLQQLARANNIRAPAYAVRQGQAIKLAGCK